MDSATLQEGEEIDDNHVFQMRQQQQPYKSDGCKIQITLLPLKAEVQEERLQPGYMSMAGE